MNICRTVKPGFTAWLRLLLNCGVLAATAALGQSGGSRFTVQSPLTSGNPSIHNNRLIQQALAHTVQMGPTASLSLGDQSYSGIIELLKRQSSVAHSLLVPAVRPVSANSSGPLLGGGTGQMLKPQPYPPKVSSPQIAAGQTMSASGAPSGMGNSSVASSVQSGPSAYRPPSLPQPQRGNTAPVAAHFCRAGIATVDGGTSGVWFSPVPGADGMFVIQGCGFGASLGQVYLRGVQYAPTSLGRSMQDLPGATQHPDRVTFQVLPSNWSDRQIIAQIDPNAGGLYDTNNVRLVVMTAAGQSYQATGMNFLAARVDQPLKALLKRAGCTAQSTGSGCIPVGVTLVPAQSSNGAVTADVESPSLNLLRPGGTIAVARESASNQFPIPATPGWSFRGGVDTYEFNFVPGFQLDPQHGVQLRHASVDTAYCQSVNGIYSNGGAWNVKYTSPSSFEIYWGEEGCWPKAAISSGNSLDVLDYASVSAYELDITVYGPRGISPWPSGNVNGLATRPIQNTLPLVHP